MISRYFPLTDAPLPPFLVSFEDGQPAFGEERAFRAACEGGQTVLEHDLPIGDRRYRLSVACPAETASDAQARYQYERPLLAIFDTIEEHTASSPAQPRIHAFRTLYEQLAQTAQAWICAGLSAAPFALTPASGTELDAETLTLAAGLCLSYLCRAGNENIRMDFEEAPSGLYDITFHATRVPPSMFIQDVLTHMGEAGRFTVLFAPDGIRFRLHPCPITYVMWRSPDDSTCGLAMAIAAKLFGLDTENPALTR